MLAPMTPVPIHPIRVSPGSVRAGIAPGVVGMPHSADSTAPSALARRAVQDCRDLAASPGDAQIDDDHTLTDAELDDDAVPLSEMLGDGSRQPLPLWYMPAPSTGIGPLRGWKRVTVALVIAAFLTITAFGLCNTYGQLHL